LERHRLPSMEGLCPRRCRISLSFRHRLSFPSTTQRIFLTYPEDILTDGITHQVVDQFNLQYGSLDGEDVLHNFDFDSFLNEEDPQVAYTFDASLSFGNADGVEAGAGDI